MSTVQRKRRHPHGCAIDPEQVKEDIVASNEVGDIFVTMVSINLWCMCYFHLIKLHALSCDSIQYTPILIPVLLCSIGICSTSVMFKMCLS